jgi:murein DD-endopeptidase MepM/ murein hydrolase activator NlpD
MVADNSSRGRSLSPEIRCYSRSLKILLSRTARATAVFSSTLAVLALFQLGVSRSRADCPLASADRPDQEAAPRTEQALASRARSRNDVHQQAGAVADEVLAETGSPERINASEAKHFRRDILAPRGLAGGLRLAGLITTELVQSEREPPRVDAVITDAPPPEPEHDAKRVAEVGRRAVIQFRRLLASTGLNIGRLFPQFGPDRAEGGPFIPPPKGGQAEGFSQDKLEVMRSLIKSLPLAVPLDQYQLESRFGPRHDPFNHRRSFHTGLDLSAPYMSPVYATAGGVVTYAGYRSEYGKVVEIDHGNGIATLYGHLHRYIVGAGQRVTEHTQIGLLGSSGRSTGPHVHYEIQVNGEPQDPEKFIGLARVIPIAAGGQFEKKDDQPAQ